VYDTSQFCHITGSLTGQHKGRKHPNTSIRALHTKGPVSAGREGKVTEFIRESTVLEITSIRIPQK